MKVKVFEWLRNRNNAITNYIETGILLKQKASIKIKILWDNYIAGNSFLSIRGSSGAYNFSFNIFKDLADYGGIRGEYFKNIQQFNANGVNEFAIVYPTLYVNGNEYITRADGLLSNVTLKIFGNSNSYTNIDGAIGQIEIDNEGTKYHLVPCLTSDNEACMIDLLTGELYRNQGSGTFSVEGECLYEFETPVIKQVMRKPNVVVRLRESIRAANRARIEFPFTPNDFSIRAKYDAEEIIHGYSARIWAITYQRTNDNFGLSSDFNGTINTNIIPQYLTDGTGTTVTNLPSDTSANDVTIKQNGTYTINGIDGTYTPRVDFSVPYRFTIFNYAGSDRWFKGLVNFVEVRNGSQILDLHPCDLLHHPTLHHQSCMIDLLTGDLYTNQGTGNFTCEGEDLGIWTDTMFEDMRIKDVKADMVVIKHNGEPRVVYERVQPFVEHRWLVANVPTGCTMLTLQVNDTLRYKRLWKQLGNVGYVRNDNFAFYSADNNKLNTVSIWNIKTQSSGLGYLINDGVIDVSINPKNYKIGTFESQDYLGDNILFVIGNNANGQREAIFNTSTITIDGHTLTPIQLTRNLFPHEIASSNTALRGECGFADKEKYLRGEAWFYGNRATSGKFGVSDEE